MEIEDVEDTAMFGDDPRASSARSNDRQRGTGPAGSLVPVAFSFTRRRVRLIDLSGVECREQSFRQTVERWIADHPQLTPIELEWSAFIAAARQTPLPGPAGFIFNVGRCGSTLLANMLAAPSRHITLKESSTVGVLLRELLVAATEAERQELEELLAVTLPLFGRVAGLPAGLPGPRLFVKPHSLSTVTAGTLLRLFPGTPAVFLYREPGAVVASMLAAAPYGGLYDQPRERIVAVFPSLATLPADLSPAAFYAYLWCSPVEAILALPPDQFLLIDYVELVSSPAAVIQRLTRHVGMNASPETVARMSGVMGVYAKDASGQVPFDAAGVHHRPPLGAGQHDDVNSVVGNLYARLEARRREQV